MRPLVTGCEQAACLRLEAVVKISLGAIFFAAVLVLINEGTLPAAAGINP